MAHEIKNGVLIYCDGNNPTLTNISALGTKCCANNQSLQRITIPNTVKEIRYGAFLGCRQLTSCTITNTTSKKSQLSSIDGLAFYGCDQLTSIQLPACAKHIDHYAFMHSGIRSATIPGKTVSALFPTEYQNITQITMADGSIVQPYQFAGCSHLGSNVTIPNTVLELLPHSLDTLPRSTSTDGQRIQYVGKWIVGFAPNWSVINLTCGSSYDGIVGEAFAKTTVETVTISSTIKTIGSRAFANCQTLKEVIIEDDSTQIADDAFEGCPRLTCITATQNMLDKGIKNLYPRSIENIKKVIIASNAHKIPTQAFEGLTNFNNIAFSSGQITCIEPNAFPLAQMTCFPEDPETHLCCYQDWILDGSKYSTNSLTIGNDFKGIGPAAFSGNSYLNSINLKNVAYIGKSAFSDTNLNSILFNKKTIAQIKNSDGYPWGLDANSITFMRYTSSGEHTQMNLRETITSNTFKSLKSYVKEIEIGTKCTTIDAEALSGYTSLTSFDAGTHDLQIRNSALSGCTNLSSMCASSNTSFGTNVFKNCDNLTSVVMLGCPYSDKANWGNINDSNMTIVSYEISGSYFTYMKRFTGSNIRLQGSESADESEWYPTNELDFTYKGKTYAISDAVEISLQKEISDIDDFAFYNCTKLRKLTIKKTINANGDFRIGTHSLQNCFNLQELNFTGATSIITIQNLQGHDTNKHYPWGFNSIFAQNLIDIIKVGT